MTAPTPIPPPAPPTPPAPTPTPPESFTQEDVNRIVAERVARERGKFADYDAMKDKATKFDALEAENATELEKAVAKAVEDTRAEAAKTMNSTLVRAEVKALAAAAQFHDPAVAAALLAEKFATVAVDTAGQVDLNAAKALVDQLATEQPYLIKVPAGSVPAPLPGQGTPPAPPATATVAAGAALYQQHKQKT